MLSCITRRMAANMSFDKTGLYNISKKLQHPEKYLPLYNSKVFTSNAHLIQPKSSQTSSKTAKQHSDTNSYSPHFSPV